MTGMICARFAVLLSLAWAQKAPITAPNGDVFSSGGAKDDRGKYISKDGRWFDRCAYETDHMADNPYSKQYGPPDHVPINSALMRQYVRCAVDACAVNEKAVCWGKQPARTNDPPAGRTVVINCRAYGPDQLICENLPNDCVATGKKTIVCDSAPSRGPIPALPPAPVKPPANPSPAGMVPTGDPDAPDSGAPGFVGSFPGTKNKCGSFCYSYLWEKGIWDVNPGPTKTPNAVGHDDPSPGDVAVVYQRFAGTDVYQPLHFAIYQGNGLFYQRNGASSVEVVTKQFFGNFSNAIVRYVTPTPRG